ncbi:MAG: hypothetical protein ACRCXT_23755 [Paraclostridium sp.]
MQSHTIFYTQSVRGIKGIKRKAKPVVDPEDKTRILDIVSILQASVDNDYMTPEYLSSLRASAANEAEYNR